MRIGIDIDDTISNTFLTGVKYAEKYTKEYCHREYPNLQERTGNSKTHRHWQEVFEWNDEEEMKFLDRYYEQILKSVEPLENAPEILNQLYESHEIILITARWEIEKNGMTGMVENLTRTWLKENNIPYHKLYLGREKLEVCMENHVDVFIDDSYTNCKNVQSGNIKSYLMDCITNRNVKEIDVERVHNWNEIYEKLKKYEEENANGDYCSYRS